jgi:hypothetical protein
MKTIQNTLITVVCCLTAAAPLAGKADTTFTITNTVADSFLSGNAPTLNYGGAGTLAISPAGSPKGEFNSVIKFNPGSAVTQFNTTYGAGNWQIGGLVLRLASSFGTNGTVPSNNNLNPVSGGSFSITWLAGDSWLEGSGGGNGAANGAVSFNSISSLFSAGSDPLGTFTYTPPGNNVYASYTLPLTASLVSDATLGGEVSLYFSAADNQIGYLFNSRSFSTANPQLVVTAVPEPGTIALLTVMIGGLLVSRRRKECR